MSVTVNKTYKLAYARLLKRYPLYPIHNDEENAQAAEICDGLTDRIDSLSEAERDYLEVLTDLIVKYESKWSADTLKWSPREHIQYLMSQNDLGQVDLIGEFGSASRVSEFLSGYRTKLSVDQAKKLASRFHLSLESLLVE